MKISYNWLKNYIDIPYSPAELAEKLTMAGIEVEEIKTINEIPDGVIVGEILERNPHPDATKLSVCRVFTGKEELQIVCGAPNCNAGIKVALATIGTVFKSEGEEFSIKKAKLRGVDSHGMLCSSRELGLDNSHDGIMELSQDVKVGSPVADLFKPDTVYELEITSNRSDLNSFLGVAREIKTYSCNEVKLPNYHLPNIKADSKYSDLVQIKDYELCPKYTARIIKGVKVQESPKWLKERLVSIGLRPINNIVDITNYVMFELGQPLHVFDLNNLAQKKIIVRKAYDKEKITALNGNKYELEDNMLVIADAETPVAIAGIMGGEHSGVTEKTTDILIESAYFNPASIKTTSRILNLSSDSSYRFERGADIKMVSVASNRAARLILELAGGQLCSELIEVKDEKYLPKAKTVNCRFDKIRNLLGVDIANEQILKIFEGLGLSVEDVTNESCVVISTTFRLDLEREADLAEEVIRIYGLDKVPFAKIIASPGGSIKNDTHVILQEARNQLVSLGLIETVTYALMDKNIILKSNLFEEKDLLEVINPISAESSALRPSLLYGMLKSVNKNISHGNHDLRLFEMGKCYTANKNFDEERYVCCIALAGRKHPERFGDEKDQKYDFYDIKGLLESWFEIRKLTHLSCKKAENVLFKSGNAAEYFLNDKPIISFGEINPALVAGMRLRSPLFIAITEIGIICDIKRPAVHYHQIPLFPAVTRDIAMVVDEKLENSKIMECIKGINCRVLEKVEVFDIYRNESLGVNKKSIAYALTYRSHEKTLTDNEVNSTHEKIRAKLQKDLAVELR